MKYIFLSSNFQAACSEISDLVSLLGKRQVRIEVEKQRVTETLLKATGKIYSQNMNEKL